MNAGLRGSSNVQTASSQESFILVSDGYNTRELEASGWTRIHDNILVSDGYRRSTIFAGSRLLFAAFLP